MGVHTVGATTPYGLLSSSTTTTWTWYVSYPFTLLGIAWNFSTAGRSYTLTLDSVMVASGTTVVDINTVSFAPIAITPGQHTWRFGYSLTTQARIYNGPLASYIPVSEGFTSTNTVEGAGTNPIAATFTIDSPQNTSVASEPNPPELAWGTAVTIVNPGKTEVEVPRQLTGRLFP